jgi:DNA-directed RNA polymerase sigma subunit (sigma70/sigma32)
VDQSPRTGGVRLSARSFQVEGLEFADLVQEGVVGLLRALERCDPGRRGEAR